MKKLSDRLHAAIANSRYPNSGASSFKSLFFALLMLVLIIGLVPAVSVGAQPAQQTTNLALNRPVTCSGSPQFPCAEAVDGNTGTRWASAQAVDPQFIQVDLGATYNISRVVLVWEAAYATGYQVQVSGSATGPWTNIFSTTTGNGATDDLTGLSGSGRYVRMNGTARATQFGYSLWEFQVYGTTGTVATATRTPTNTVGASNTPPPAGCGTSNVALGKAATASSNENAGTTPNLAVDGNAGTRWSSAASDPQWIQIDLGSTQSICRVVLTWEAAYGTAYQVQVSASATGPWANIFSTTTGNGATDDLTSLSGSGRYIRMNGTARATQYGYSLWEFAVYTGSGGPTPTTGPTATRTMTPIGPTPTNTVGASATRTNTPVSGGSVMLSYHVPAVASTVQNDANCANCTADKVVDADMGTRWATAWADPQWVYLDLGASANITRVVLKWEAAFASAYQIQTSTNASTWTAIYTTTTGNGATDDLTLSGSGRYVRLYATARGTGFGYSLFEFEVYGTGGAPQATPTPRPTSTPHGAWVLAWSDEFNGPNIDTTNWNYETGCTGYGNGEWENYTNGANSAIQFDAQANSNVMIIEARQTGAAAACGYTSSRMTTAGKREFTYGRIEARLKLPQTQGIWPAFWMMGNNIGTVGWPTNGEIDIMEHIGALPSTSSGALHGPGYSGGGNIGGAFTHSEPVNLNYHLYAIEWSPDQIKWFVDSNNFLTVTRDQVQTRGAWVYDHPFFILLNVAVGGAWPGNPDGTSQFPQRMYVDYIRVYR